MDGFGHLKWPDGIEYIGELLDNKFHGYGQYFWADGSSYSGKWF